jgi:hypothetical protein
MTTTQTLTVTTLTNADRVRRQVAYMNGPTRGQIEMARRRHARLTAEMHAADDAENIDQYLVLAEMIFDLESEFAPYGVRFGTVAR